MVWCPAKNEGIALGHAKPFTQKLVRESLLSFRGGVEATFHYLTLTEMSE